MPKLGLGGRPILLAPAPDDPNSFISSGYIQQDMGITSMARYRWLTSTDPNVKFPRPDLVLNRRRYWLRGTYEGWKKRVLRKRVLGTPPIIPPGGRKRLSPEQLASAASARNQARKAKRKLARAAAQQVVKPVRPPATRQQRASTISPAT